jgi:RNA polymerase sigma factor (sigma-70 family)
MTTEASTLPRAGAGARRRGGCGRRLSARRERELVLTAKANRERRDELVEAFLPLIMSVARIYRNTGSVSAMELKHEGVVGLLRALERYDPALGTPFWGYASWWVRQAMQRLVSELSRPIVLSDRALRQLARIKNARRAYGQVHGTDPSPQQLASVTGLRRQQVESLLAAERRPRRLDQPGANDDGGCELGSRLTDPESQDRQERLPENLAVEALPGMMTKLTGRERLILRGRFGFDGPERTLRELADGLGVSAERVRQIEGAALEKLRHARALSGIA